MTYGACSCRRDADVTCDPCADGVVRHYLRLVAQLDRSRWSGDELDLERSFTRFGQSVAVRRNLRRDAWVAFGVDPRVLDLAGIG